MFAVSGLSRKDNGADLDYFHFLISAEFGRDYYQVLIHKIMHDPKYTTALYFAFECSLCTWGHTGFRPST